MLDLILLRRYVFSRRAGSLIRNVAWMCACGIAIGIFSLVVVLSVMNGLNRSIQERLLSVEPHLVVFFNTEASDQSTERATKWIGAQPEIRQTAFEEQDVIVRSAEGFTSGAIARGIEKDALIQILRQTRKLYDGSVSDEAEFTVNSLKPGEAFIGVELGNTLKIFEGDDLTLVSPESLLMGGEIPQFERIKIKNFLESEYGIIDSQMIFYLRENGLPRLAESASYRRGLELRIPDPHKVGSYREELEKLGVKVETWRERNSSLFFALSTERWVVGILVGLSALISAFSVISVLVLLMTQKRKDVGLLMALGLSPKASVRVFMNMGLGLSTAGIFVGLILGLLTTFILDNYSENILPDFYYDRSIPAEILPGQIFVVIVLALSFCALSCFLAVRSFGRMTPVEVLRRTPFRADETEA